MKTLIGVSTVLLIAIVFMGCNNHRRHAAGEPIYFGIIALFDSDNSKKDTREQREALIAHAKAFNKNFLEPIGHGTNSTQVITESDPEEVNRLCMRPPGSNITGCAYDPHRQLDPKNHRVYVLTGEYNECAAFLHELGHVNAEKLGILHDHKGPIWADIDRVGGEVSIDLRNNRTIQP